ncbi:MAG: beta-galactosidase [Candidatus Hydrogenedentes bacterium]|nr:beta-galactosidase [Candidatus Hydrogenedentota bacterium]
MGRFRPPYLGAAYYPETWPREQLDEDIKLMRDAGMNVMRIAEFAWSSMEPAEGRLELGWLRRVVDKLAEAGIATIMCTPSCTPPAWLTEKYPEVLVVSHAGVRARHGSRRHVCPNSPIYRGHCERIVTRLAEMFGQDENVIGWQIDNEVDLWKGEGCFCDLCVRLFRERLRKKFGSIDALNESWGTHLWSMTYQSFEQIPAPEPSIHDHPSLSTAWTLFQSDSMVDYVLHQASILHEHVSQPVGTDMMPILSVSYEKLHRHLDIVQYNHYDSMETLWKQVFWMDYVRPFKTAPFWNTETATCWNGGVTANGYKDPGFCRVNSWLPIALGAEANLYWLWRAHWSGQELMHGSVVSSHGRPLHIMGEVKEVAKGFEAAGDFLSQTVPAPTGLAVHVSTVAWAQFRHQPMANGFDYLDCLLNRVCRPLMDVHLRVDFIDPADSLTDYRVVYSPFLPALDESRLRERLWTWIEAGGTWVVGPLSDTRTLEATKPAGAPFASLEEWADIYCAYEVPGDPRDFAFRWNDGTASHGSLWYSGFETEKAKVLASYLDGPLKGMAAITETRVGIGRIIVLGTLLNSQDMRALMLRVCGEAEIVPAADASPNVLVVPRVGEGGSGTIVMEIENRTGYLQLHQPCKDILTARNYDGRVEIEPYQVLVLQTERSIVSDDGALAGHVSDRGPLGSFEEAP